MRTPPTLEPFSYTGSAQASIEVRLGDLQYDSPRRMTCFALPICLLGFVQGIYTLYDRSKLAFGDHVADNSEVVTIGLDN